MRKLITIVLAVAFMAALALQAGCTSTPNPSPSPEASASTQAKQTDANETAKPTEMAEASTPAASTEPTAPPSETLSSIGGSANAQVGLGGSTSGPGAENTDGWALVDGNFFTCLMPGIATVDNEETTGDSDFSDMGMTATMYTYENGAKEFYGVIEVDWSSLMEQYKTVADSVSKEEFTEVMMEAFGGKAGAEVVHAGEIKALKADASVLAGYSGNSSITGSSSTEEVYIAFYDQAYILIFYAGSKGNYSADNVEKFLSSFKAVGLTEDLVSVGD